MFELDTTVENSIREIHEGKSEICNSVLPVSGVWRDHGLNSLHNPDWWPDL